MEDRTKLTSEEIEKACAEGEPIHLYHLWLPMDLYEKAYALAEAEKKSLNHILVRCVEEVLGNKDE